VSTPLAPPAAFAAFVVEGTDRSGPVRRGTRRVGPDDLPPGEVLIRVAWSSINFKDGLAARAGGRVARISPLIPGIDLAGIVLASEDPDIRVGDPVLVHGYELGTNRHGGYAEYARVPAAWVVPVPDGLSMRDSMAIGTAGFTAAMAVVAIAGRGIEPDAGPVLVTGASGGVGRVAIDLLAHRGYEVFAATGKADEESRLRELGAAAVIARSEVTPGTVRPLETARWVAAVDTVGGPTLPYLLSTMRIGGVVAACGNAGGASFTTTTMPFILRGVALLGMDSANMPIAPRRALWRRIAADLRPRHLSQDVTEVDLAGLEPALDAIVVGEARGRWVVRVSG
jgi:acrylyl-CoA reductase (NADPH)